jgi:hypothetical protein
VLLLAVRPPCSISLRVARPGACSPRPPCVQSSGSPTRASLSPSPLVSMPLVLAATLSRSSCAPAFFSLCRAPLLADAQPLPKPPHLRPSSGASAESLSTSALAQTCASLVPAPLPGSSCARALFSPTGTQPDSSTSCPARPLQRRSLLPISLLQLCCRASSRWSSARRASPWSPIAPSSDLALLLCAQPPDAFSSLPSSSRAPAHPLPSRRLPLPQRHASVIYDRRSPSPAGSPSVAPCCPPFPMAGAPFSSAG